MVRLKEDVREVAADEAKEELPEVDGDKGSTERWTRRTGTRSSRRRLLRGVPGTRFCGACM